MLKTCPYPLLAVSTYEVPPQQLWERKYCTTRIVVWEFGMSLAPDGIWIKWRWMYPKYRTYTALVTSMGHANVKNSTRAVRYTMHSHIPLIKLNHQTCPARSSRWMYGRSLQR